jgi:hypothetical protein
MSKAVTTSERIREPKHPSRLLKNTNTTDGSASSPQPVVGRNAAARLAMHGGAVRGLVPTGRGVRTGVLWVFFVVFVVLAATVLGAPPTVSGTAHSTDPPGKVGLPERSPGGHARPPTGA